MPSNIKHPSLLRARREWQVWLFLILGLGLTGLGIAVYATASAPQSEAGGAVQLLPPILYGLFAIILLLNFYLARKEAIVDALREQLSTQQVESELNRELALLDPVTDVYNRRYARIILQREVSRANRSGSMIAIMMLDITGFRKVNESLGHAGGDAVLREVAHLLQEMVRDSDIIIRFGGDEFLLVLPEAQPEGIEKLALRMRKALNGQVQNAGLKDFGLRFALGIAYYKSDTELDAVLSLAEKRMLEDRSVPQRMYEADEGEPDVKHAIQAEIGGQ